MEDREQNTAVGKQIRHGNMSGLDPAASVAMPLQQIDRKEPRASRYGCASVVGRVL